MSLTNEELVTELQHLRNNITKLKERCEQELNNLNETINYKTNQKVLAYSKGIKLKLEQIIEDLEEL